MIRNVDTTNRIIQLAVNVLTCFDNKLAIERIMFFFSFTQTSPARISIIWIISY